MRILRLTSSLAGTWLPILAALSYGQTTNATVSGLITDGTNAVLPATTVTLINLNTGVVSTARSNGGGFYRIADLLPGSYKASASKDGFKNVVKTNIELHVEDSISLNFSMEVGSVVESISLDAAQPLLQSDSSTVSTIIESEQVESTPLNGRNVMNLLALVPGVVPQGATSGSPLNNQAAIGNFTNPSGWGNYQIGGGAGGQNSEFVDGAPITTPIENWLTLVPSEDAVQEFRVETNNISSEYGRYYGGVVNFSTKSGTNTFHGTTYEFLRNTMLDANNFFNNRTRIARPYQLQNQYGASLGGPVFRNKLFFFVNWEGFANRSGLPYAARVPTAAELTGDFTADAPIYFYGVTPQMQVSCNGVLNKICPDPTASYLANTIGYWAPPNVPNVPEGDVNFQTNAASGSNSNQVDARGDYSLGQHQLFARYTFWGTHTLATNYFHNNVPQPLINSTTDQAVIGDNWAITPSTVLDARLSFTHFYYVSYPPFLGHTDLSRIPALAPLASQMTFDTLPVINLVGYSPIPFPFTIINVINYDNFNTSVLTANVTKTIGKHTLRFGGTAWQIQAAFVKPPTSVGGSFVFETDSPTTNLFANFLLGADVANTSTVSTSQGIAIVEPYGATYFTDTYNATTKLTVHAGLRWDLPGGFEEKKNLNTELLPNTASPLGSIANPATGENQVLRGNLALVDTSQYPSRYDNPLHKALIAPNIGMTYRVFTDTVVRAGYGLSYTAYDTGDPSPLDTPINAITAPATGPLSNPFPQLSGVLPRPVGRSSAYSAAIQGVSIFGRIPNDPYPYVQQWNLSIQQQFGQNSAATVGYVGSKGTHMPINLNLNVLSDAEAGQAAMQYSNLVAGGQSASNATAQTYLNVLVPNPLAGMLAPASAYNGAKVATGQLLRPFPQFANVTQIADDSGSSTYHALQASYIKKFAASGSFSAAFSWSKVIGTVDTNTGFLESYTVGGIQDPNNLAAERSLTSFDVPLRLVLNYSLSLPFGRSRQFVSNLGPVADQVVSGWVVSSITTFQSGFPLAFTAQPNNLSTSFGFGTIRPDVMPGCQAQLGGSTGSRLGRSFNTSCYVQPPTPFSLGNESRVDSHLWSQGIDNWDLALAKEIALHERMHLSFTTQFLNSFNRVEFGPPGTQVGSTSFGKETSQVNTPRQIQFALRLSF
jgi:Carboxypeptidase regulatory-like domain